MDGIRANGQVCNLIDCERYGSRDKGVSVDGAFLFRSCHMFPFCALRAARTAMIFVVTSAVPVTVVSIAQSEMICNRFCEFNNLFTKIAECQYLNHNNCDISMIIYLNFHIYPITSNNHLINLLHMWTGV